MNTRYTFTWGFLIVGLLIGSMVIVNCCMCVGFIYERCQKKNKVCVHIIFNKILYL